MEITCTIFTSSKMSSDELNDLNAEQCIANQIQTSFCILPMHWLCVVTTVFAFYLWLSMYCNTVLCNVLIVLALYCNTGNCNVTQHNQNQNRSLFLLDLDFAALLKFFLSSKCHLLLCETLSLKYLNFKVSSFVL